MLRPMPRGGVGARGRRAGDPRPTAADRPSPLTRLAAHPAGIAVMVRVAGTRPPSHGGRGIRRPRNRARAAAIASAGSAGGTVIRRIYMRLDMFSSFMSHYICMCSYM